MGKRGVKAIGIDLGHTLMYYNGVPASWSSLYPQALRAAYAAVGEAPDEAELEKACERLSLYNTRVHPREAEIGARSIFADVLQCADGAAIEPAVDAFFGRVRRSFALYGDAVPFLTRMKTAGVPCGVLTDVPYGMPQRWVDKDVEPFRPWLSAVLSSVGVGFRKPNAAGFLALARSLGVEPGRMAYVGDEEKDVLGAKVVGMVSVLLDRQVGLPDFGEDVRINSLDEFDCKMEDFD